MRIRFTMLLTSTVFLSPVAFAKGDTTTNDEGMLDAVVVTASSRKESQRESTATIQVIDSEQIEHSGTNSITDLLAQNAVGFLSEWTPAQTSINIRGAASDGQGRDYKGQVLVLIDGRRAGTANLSKLSPKDVERIEIVRGPASVIYGSQAMGGVINIIMKNGHNTQGGKLTVEGGSWGTRQGYGEYGARSDDGKFYSYIGMELGRADDYHSGSGGKTMRNTGWERKGASGSFGWQADADNLIDFSVRTDGIYNTGFRGSGGNLYSQDDRYNQSADLTWQHGHDEDKVRWKAHAYFVRDVDDFDWASPVVAKTSVDHNKRTLDIGGIRLQPIVKLSQSNELLLGLDAEHSQLRSTRYRAGLKGAAISQVAPYDNNQTEKVYGLYFDDAQKLLDDRLLLRGGMRYTYGQTYFDETPNLANQLSGQANYKKTTGSLGTNFKVVDGFNLKASAATGFRAPTASELGADFVSVGGTQYFGNSSLKPESNLQYEVGAVFSGRGWFSDIALFQNTISDRITTKARSSSGTTYDYINNPADVVIRGIEANNRIVMNDFVGLKSGWDWTVMTNVLWNFYMKDEAVKIGATANTDKVQRMYEYQASLTNRVGASTGGYPWNIQLQGILRGPMWYDTEEKLVAGAEPYGSYVHRKSAFWVWNLRGEVELTKKVSVYAYVNNVFDKNEHPIYIALDQTPYIMLPSNSNGDLGTSMAGRSFFAGATLRF